MNSVTKSYLKPIYLSAVLLALGACTSLNDEDRALLESAVRNSEAAQQESKRAADSIDSVMERVTLAEQNSARSAQAAEDAASRAQLAAEKADRIFTSSLRK